MRFETISPDTLDQYVKNPDVFIIDLREPDEYMERHILGAVNIPYERLENCHFPQEMELVLYCDRGAVSMAAAKELAQKGYRVKTVVGGMHAYRGKYATSFGGTEKTMH